MKPNNQGDNLDSRILTPENTESRKFVALKE